MAGWTWCIIGLILFVAELVLPSGFFLFLMGVSGIIVGLVSLTGLLVAWPYQLVLFCIVALVLWYSCSTKLKGLLKGAATSSDGTTGQVVRVTSAVPHGEVGSGELWGSPWRIKNVGPQLLVAGSEAIVVGSEGVTLHVRHHTSS